MVGVREATVMRRAGDGGSGLRFPSSVRKWLHSACVLEEGATLGGTKCHIPELSLQEMHSLPPLCSYVSSTTHSSVVLLLACFSSLPLDSALLEAGEPGFYSSVVLPRSQGPA